MSAIPALYETPALQVTLNRIRQELASMNSVLQNVLATQNKSNSTSNSFSLRQIGLFLLAAGGAAAAYFYFNSQKAPVISPDASKKQQSDAEMQTENTTTSTASVATMEVARALPVDASTQTGDAEGALPAAATAGFFSGSPARSPSPVEVSPVNGPLNAPATAPTQQGGLLNIMTKWFK